MSLRKCDLCFAECKYEATNHLNLPLYGSEGIRVCFACWKAMGDIAKRIRECGMRLKNMEKQNA
jgi:hypothetical protein